MKVSARQDVSGDRRSHAALRRAYLPFLRKDQRIVHRRVHFDLKDLATMGQGIADRAVDLRDAAQRIGILHLLTLAMRLANQAAFQHAAQVLRDQ